MFCFGDMAHFRYGTKRNVQREPEIFYSIGKKGNRDFWVISKDFIRQPE